MASIQGKKISFLFLLLDRTLKTEFPFEMIMQPNSLPLRTALDSAQRPS